MILRLIGKWLNAGVMKKRGISYPGIGTPKEWGISPLLSNIYFHEVLDKWYEKEIRRHLKGRSFMIRFADDAILGFENQREAEGVMKALKDRLMGYGLELHPGKTRLVYFDQMNDHKSNLHKPSSFDFLGFTDYWGKSLK